MGCKDYFAQNFGLLLYQCVTKILFNSPVLVEQPVMPRYPALVACCPEGKQHYFAKENRVKMMFMKKELVVLHDCSGIINFSNN